MISAVVLAAGLSTRMGRPKMVLLVEGKPMLQKVLDALRGARVDETVVVLGPEASKIRSQVRFERERVVVNSRYAQGMSTSLRLGLATVSPEAEAALVVMGDQPFLSSSTIDMVIEGFREGAAPIVVPVYRGVRGNPVLFAKSVFPEAMRVRGDVGARSVVRSYGSRVAEVPVEDEGVLSDLDTPEEYGRAHLRNQSARRTRNLRGA